MKKCKVIFAVVMAMAVLFVGVVKVRVNANELENTEKSSGSREVSVEQFEKILPVITALSGHIHTRNSGYHAYKSNFYETSLNGILQYGANDDLFEYTEDENNFYLDKSNMSILSDVAYWGGDYEKIHYSPYTDVAYYDKDSQLYIIKKNEVDLGYEVKLTKAIEKECEHGMNYKLIGELYKNGEKIDNISVDILENENGNCDIAYAVHWLWLDNYGIEVY